MNYNEYESFVKAVSSDETTSLQSLIERLEKLEKDGASPSRLLTGAIGLTSEAGEVAEIVKKVVFQGKEFSDDVKFHLTRELSDVFWYITQLCMVLGITFDDIIKCNVDKLQTRYPGEVFDVERSEHRAHNDL